VRWVGAAGDAAELGAVSGPDLPPAAGDLVHGLAGDLVAPDWAPLGDAEAERVRERWDLGPGPASVRWRSPRPLSAAGLVAVGGRTVFVKRHDLRVRPVDELTVEHRFAAHLRARGVPVPEVLATPDGATAVSIDGNVLEVHALAPGHDLYRDAASWTGFRAADHAREAGAALARLHRAAADFDEPPRPLVPLGDGVDVVAAADPLAALDGLVGARPGLAAALAPHRWREEVPDELGFELVRAAHAAAPLPPGWTHGDWHPSNLTWDDAGRPAAVLDLGLANRTFAVRDLAIALERTCVSWLESSPAADLDAVAALLAGYAAVRPLDEVERAALPALVPVVHVEFALSEIEYYGAILGSPERAAVAYRDYLIGHARWWRSAPGRALLERLAPSPRDAG
jgi:Ser/Thr protein kinase RdoA (MazF antagonist)